jgi:hypothetical protein
VDCIQSIRALLTVMRLHKGGTPDESFTPVFVSRRQRLHEGEQRLMSESVEPRGMLGIAAHPIAIEAGLPQVVKQYRADAPEVGLVLNTQPDPCVRATSTTFPYTRQI